MLLGRSTFPWAYVDIHDTGMDDIIDAIRA